jgi:hypothetical protein
MQFARLIPRFQAQRTLLGRGTTRRHLGLLIHKMNSTSTRPGLAFHRSLLFLIPLGLAGCIHKTYVQAPAAAPATVIVTHEHDSAPPAASTSMVVHEAPPPPREEQPPTSAPGPNETWIAGHWEYQSDHYVWLSGHMEVKPQPAAEWVAGHWENRSDGYVYVNGYWKQ